MLYVDGLASGDTCAPDAVGVDDGLDCASDRLFSYVELGGPLCASSTRIGKIFTF